MAAHTSARLFRRFLAGLLTLTLVLSAVTWLSAQDAGKKRGEEEEEVDKSKAKPRGKEEEEDPKSRPKRKVIVVDDDVTPKKPTPRPSEEQSGDLAEALRTTKNPELEKFYRGVHKPHDSVTVASSGRTYFVEPLTRYYPDESPRFPGGYVRARPFDQDWKTTRGVEFASPGVLRIRPYEEIVVEQAEDFLKKKLDTLPEGSKAFLSRADMLRSAELVLASAERFHTSARERRLREGEEWGPVGERLRRKLYEVRLKRLELVVNTGDWDAARDYARHLAEVYETPEEREPVAKQLVELIKQGLQGEYSEAKLKEARNRLRLIELHFPNSSAAQPVADALRNQAQALFERAVKMEKDNPQEAVRLMGFAQEIWPRLPGLGDRRLQLANKYPVLKVGVRELPVEMLPGLESTDVERQAVELMFEGLVRVRYQPGVGQRYEPVLAASLPRMVPLGRQFQLVRDAYWSNDEPVTAADVAATVRLLNDPRWPGSNPALGKLLVEKPDLGGDAFRLSLTLKQGYIDPLSLMTFKVLPRGVEAQVREMARKPVGSGPYRFGGQVTFEDRPCARFAANPNYASRENRLGLPRVREILFLQCTDPDPVTALAKREVDLVAHVPGPRVKELRGAEGVVVRDPMPNRRVYFLAVNHRRRPLQNVALRRALAMAIDREKLLNDFFRGDLGKEAHRALNGPYPAGSWACDPNVPPGPELYRAEQAKALVKTVVDKVGSAPKLSLKYPSGDPDLRRAMESLRDGVRDTIGVSLELEAVDPLGLRDQVRKTHEYELAYCHYDFPSEAYWLWPLFDPNGTDEGTNYLGYIDSGLVSLFGQAMSHRDFGRVRETTRLIHRMIDQQMPLVPLWQLDTIVAHSRDVSPAGIDPLVIFSDVDQWTKEVK
jgi:peptide/nickel transport system substrate-binding protein